MGLIDYGEDIICSFDGKCRKAGVLDHKYLVLLIDQLVLPQMSVRERETHLGIGYHSGLVLGHLNDGKTLEVDDSIGHYWRRC